MADEPVTNLFLNAQYRTLLLLEKKGIVEECECLRCGSYWELTELGEKILNQFDGGGLNGCYL
ncbi:hypothetical protein [Photobacterium kishitanii]|uniref:Uncharacterized protein n=1 Tax=Photobacterium kishitanii TaxID=318456 RepID=A0A2T3KM48_9GAMM|nr:hypothetical protein [Photobacterium kishitanii]PSV00858.1 hypothetical protein C9J27_02195 [Photobacterium kishitanii]